MPRTKRPSKATSNESTQKPPANTNVDKRLRNQKIDAYLRQFDLNCEQERENLELARVNALRKLKHMSMECKMLVSNRIGNTPLEDLDKVLAESTNFITATDMTSSTIKRTRRSLSLTGDKSHLISEISQTSERGRTPMKTKQSKPIRSSRSLSRSKSKHTSSVLSSYNKTPLNRAPMNEFGFITPKVKPNTPQVVLRRPKEGELAISMQGSPLLVNTIVSREANVNIPLEDGRTISIQPQHGLRMSQIPTIEDSIRKQIEVLRDNLIKVCESTK